MIAAADESRDSPQGADVSELPEKLLLTADEAAHLLSISSKTLEAWRAADKGPPFIRLGDVGKGRAGKGVRYSMDGLRKWIADQTKK